MLVLVSKSSVVLAVLLAVILSAIIALFSVFTLSTFFVTPIILHASFVATVPLVGTLTIMVTILLSAVAFIAPAFIVVTMAAVALSVTLGTMFVAAASIVAAIFVAMATVSTAITVIVQRSIISFASLWVIGDYLLIIGDLNCKSNRFSLFLVLFISLFFNFNIFGELIIVYVAYAVSFFLQSYKIKED